MIHTIVPGILEKNWEEIERKIELVLPFADTIHIDLIDGKFVDNQTFFDPTPFKKYTGKVLFELHMMVVEPEQYLKPWADVGFRRFYGHVEHMSDQVSFVAQGQLLGEVGLALDGDTPVSTVTVPLDDVDCMLIYTSGRVGFSGPPFQVDRLEKIKTLRSQSETLFIEVDGGVTDETLPLALRQGANAFVSTSFLYNKGSIDEQYKKLHNASLSLLRSSS